MRRGTTPTLKIDTKGGVDLNLIEKIYITLEQDSKQITKREDDLVIDLDTGIISLYLTQEETLGFKAGPKVSVQIRAAMKDGTKIGTEIAKIPVTDVLYEGII